MLRHLNEIALVDGTIRLAVGMYAFGIVALHLRTKGMRLLGEEGVLITHTVAEEEAIHTVAPDVVIEKVAVHRITEGNGAVQVDQCSLTLKDCDLRGQVSSLEGAKMLLQNCTFQRCHWPAVVVHGNAVIQDCVIQDCPGATGIQVEPAGEVAVMGTTIRRCQDGLFVTGKATIGNSSITACTQSGVFAWKTGGGPGVVTVEGGLICEGNNSSNDENEGDYVTDEGGEINGVAAEKIKQATALW